MSAPAEGRRRPWWWWALWGLLALALAGQTLRMRIAEGAVRDRNGSLAALVRPQNGWGRALQADRFFEQGDSRRAIAESLAAIDRTPLAVVAVRTLAMARDKVSGPGAGEAAWQAASLMGWRDKETQLWGVLRALSNGEAAILAMRADALLRTRDQDGRMATLLRQLMREPEVRAAFLERLQLNPSWRRHFLTTPLSASGGDLDGLVATITELARTPSPPSRTEIDAAVEALIARGRHAEAIALDRLVAPDRNANGRLLDDGSFDRADRFYRQEGSPFDWSIRQLATATANLDESEGRSMTVSTNGRAAELALRRYVALPPGTYRLRYSVRGEANAPAALGVRISCPPAAKPIAESSREPLASRGWQARELIFRTGADCPIVTIGLGGFAGGAAEAQFDNFELERASGSTDAQPAR